MTSPQTLYCQHAEGVYHVVRQELRRKEKEKMPFDAVFPNLMYKQNYIYY